MKIEITLDRENPLLGRREIQFEVAHEGAATPNKFEVSELLAAKLNAQADLMIVSLSTRFGSNTSRGTCVIYKDRDAMNTAESEKILNEKKRLGKAPEEAPAEAKEEAPAEAKEEPAKEEKQEEPEGEKAAEEAPAKEPEEGEKSEAQDSEEK